MLSHAPARGVPNPKRISIFCSSSESADSDAMSPRACDVHYMVAAAWPLPCLHMCIPLFDSIVATYLVLAQARCSHHVTPRDLEPKRRSASLVRFELPGSARGANLFRSVADVKSRRDLVHVGTILAHLIPLVLGAWNHGDERTSDLRLGCVRCKRCHWRQNA